MIQLYLCILAFPLLTLFPLREGCIIPGSSRSLFQAKCTHIGCKCIPRGFQTENKNGESFINSQNSLPISAEMLPITVLLSGNKIRQPWLLKQACIPFLFLSPVWEEVETESIARKFCYAITIVNYFKKHSKILSTSQITSTLILFLSPVVLFFCPLISDGLKNLHLPLNHSLPP